MHGSKNGEGERGKEVKSEKGKAKLEREDFHFINEFRSPLKSQQMYIYYTHETELKYKCTCTCMCIYTQCTCTQVMFMYMYIHVHVHEYIHLGAGEGGLLGLSMVFRL